MRRLLPFLLLLLAAPPAQAAVYTGEGADPAGDGPAPGVDIVAASWSLDDAAGTIAIAVTLAAAPDAENWGVINASFRTACEDGAEFATMRVNSRTTTAGGAGVGTYDESTTGPTYFATTNVKSDGGRTTTAEGTHVRLVGRRPGCVRITLSHNATLDSVVMPVKQAAGPPTAPYVIPAAPGAPPAPPVMTPKPSDVRLGSSRRIRFKRDRARLGFIGLAAGMSVRLRLQLKSGRLLATGRYVAKRTQPALITLTLTKRGRAYLRRHRRFKPRLVVTTKLAAAGFTRRYTLTVVR